jgi:UDP-N-acetylmuramate--alanine ligase
MIGMKGTGMSALAVNLKSMGFEISGSDFKESFFTDPLLKKHGFSVSQFSADNLEGKDLIIVSTAYNEKNNAELAEAVRRKKRIMTYPEVIGALSYKLPSVSVCGSHGKTTTSGIISFLFSHSRYRPIVNVGSIVSQLMDYSPQNPRLFIFEADEYQNKFQYFNPGVVVLTNIDYDHPDYFKNENQYRKVFEDYLKRLPANGLLIYCADDEISRELAKKVKAHKISFGFSNKSDIKVGIESIVPGEMKIKLTKGKRSWGQYKSKLVGDHNALNITAAVICAKHFKLAPLKILKSLANFEGTSRRMEIKKITLINGYKCIIMDDYGHHPTEIKATISAIKKSYPKLKLWTVFQPHTFSRTEALFNDFAKSFQLSDETIILDIYPSKRETEGKIHARDLVKKILADKDIFEKQKVYYISNIAGAARLLKDKIKEDCLILTIGASNVWELEKYF